MNTFKRSKHLLLLTRYLLCFIEYHVWMSIFDSFLFAKKMDGRWFLYVIVTPWQLDQVELSGYSVAINWDSGQHQKPKIFACSIFSCIKKLNFLLKMSKVKPQMGKLTQRKSMTQTYEFQDFMQNIKPPEKTFGQFLYDSDTGKFLTRTPKSWCKK